MIDLGGPIPITRRTTPTSSITEDTHPTSLETADEARRRVEETRARLADAPNQFGRPGEHYWFHTLPDFVDHAQNLHDLRNATGATQAEIDRANSHLESLSPLISNAFRDFEHNPAYQDYLRTLPRGDRQDFMPAFQDARTRWATLGPQVGAPPVTPPAPTPATPAPPSAWQRSFDLATTLPTNPQNVFPYIDAVREDARTNTEVPRSSQSWQLHADYIREAMASGHPFTAEQQQQLQTRLGEVDLERHRARITELPTGALPPSVEFPGRFEPNPDARRRAESQDAIAIAEGRPPAAQQTFWRQYAESEQTRLAEERARIQAQLNPPSAPAATTNPTPNPTPNLTPNPTTNPPTGGAPSGNAPTGGAPNTTTTTASADPARRQQLEQQLAALDQQSTRVNRDLERAEAEQRTRMLTLEQRLRTNPASPTNTTPQTGPNAPNAPNGPNAPNTPAPQNPQHAAVQAQIRRELDSRATTLGDQYRARAFNPERSQLETQLGTQQTDLSRSETALRTAEADQARFRGGNFTRTTPRNGPDGQPAVHQWTAQDFDGAVSDARLDVARDRSAAAGTQARIAGHETGVADAHAQVWRHELVTALAQRRMETPPAIGPLGFPPELEARLAAGPFPPGAPAANSAQGYRDFLLGNPNARLGGPWLEARTWLQSNQYAPISSAERTQMNQWATRFGFEPVYERGIYGVARMTNETWERHGTAAAEQTRVEGAHRDAVLSYNRALQGRPGVTPLNVPASPPSRAIGPPPPIEPDRIVGFPRGGGVQQPQREATPIPVDVPPGTQMPAPRPLEIHGPDTPSNTPPPPAQPPAQPARDPFENSPHLTAEDRAQITRIEDAWRSLSSNIGSWVANNFPAGDAPRGPIRINANGEPAPAVPNEPSRLLQDFADWTNNTRTGREAMQVPLQVWRGLVAPALEHPVETAVITGVVAGALATPVLGTITGAGLLGLGVYMGGRELVQAAQHFGRGEDGDIGRGIGNVINAGANLIPAAFGVRPWMRGARQDAGRVAEMFGGLTRPARAELAPLTLNGAVQNSGRTVRVPHNSQEMLAGASEEVSNQAWRYIRDVRDGRVRVNLPEGEGALPGGRHELQVFRHNDREYVIAGRNADAASPNPVLELDMFARPLSRPTLTNPGHHVPPQLREPGVTYPARYRSGASHLPADAEQVYQTAIPAPGTNGRTWWGRSADGHYYRYQSSPHGQDMHWNGTTDPNALDVTRLDDVPAAIRQQLARRNQANPTPAAAGPNGPRQVPTVLNPTATEAAEATRLHGELRRVAGLLGDRPLEVPQALQSPELAAVRTNLGDPLRVGQSQIGRIDTRATQLRNANPQLSEAQARELAVAEYFSDGAAQYYFHDPATNTVHAPRELQVYGNGAPQRALDMSNPIEAELARQHGRLLLEEYAHGAGFGVRDGSYMPLSPQMRGFDTWLNAYLGNPQNAGRHSANEIASIRRTLHEADIMALLEDISPFSIFERERYPIRDLYAQFRRQR